jgi:hypothetical protein
LLEGAAESPDLLEALPPLGGRDDDRRKNAKLFIPRVVDVDQMHPSDPFAIGLLRRGSRSGLPPRELRVCRYFLRLRGKDSNLDYLIQSQASYH